MSGTIFAPVWQPDLRDESIQAAMYTCLAVCSFGSFASTCFRFLVKWKYGVRFLKDDWSILFSTVVNFVANVLQFIAISHGFGRHTQFLSVEDCIDANKYALMTVPLSVIANLGSKLCIGFLILSLIKGTHRRLYRTTAATMIIMVVMGLLLVILWSTQTAPQPLSKIWNPMEPGPFPDVWKFLALLYVIGGFNICTDLLYCLSPMYFLRNVRGIGRKNKIFIQILVGSGLLVTVVACVSLTYAKTFLALVDMTWTLVPRYICDMLERNLAVVIANAPMVKTMSTKRRASQYGSSGKEYNSKPSYRSGPLHSDGSSGGTLETDKDSRAWFAQESISEPATMDVEISGGVQSHPSTRNSLIDLPLEGTTTKGLRIMKSVDITVEGVTEGPSADEQSKAGRTSCSSEARIPVLPVIPEPAPTYAPPRKDSCTSLSDRPKGPSRAASTTSLSSNMTGRYSLFPPSQVPPTPDTLIPRLM